MKKKNIIAAGILMSAVFIPKAVFASDISIVVNGNTVESDVAPQITAEGRTIVPLRVISENFGAKVEWDGSTKTVTVDKDNTKLVLKIGEKSINNNGTNVELDSPAQILDGRTMVPLRVISESFGCDVDWNAETKTVYITDNSNADSEKITLTQEIQEEQPLRFYPINSIDGKHYVINHQGLNGLSDFPVKDAIADQLVSFCEYNNKLYYIDSAEGDSVSPAYIVRADKDGSEKEILCANASNDTDVFIYKDKLYYCSMEALGEYGDSYNDSHKLSGEKAFRDFEDGIFAIDLNDLSREKITDGTLAGMDDKYIYSSVWSDNGTRTDQKYELASEKTETEENIFEKMGFIYKGKRFFTETEPDPSYNTILFCTDENGTEAAFRGTNIDIVSFADGYLYFTDDFLMQSDGKTSFTLYKLSLDDLKNAEALGTVENNGYGF